jgi:hypothetical protein
VFVCFSRSVVLLSGVFPTVEPAPDCWLRHSGLLLANTCLGSRQSRARSPATGEPAPDCWLRHSGLLRSEASVASGTFLSVACQTQYDRNSASSCASASLRRSPLRHDMDKV